MGGELSKQKRANIIEVDSHISKQVYKNQEGYRLPTLEDIYHIPSAIGKEYSRMSKTEKALFWLTGFALLGVAGYASSDAVKKTVDKNYEKGSKFVKEKYANVFAPAPAVVVPAPNASAVATPQVSGTPQPDYYDPDFKVGIMIEGDSQFKQNVTNLIETFKQVTPDDYADLIKYAPKRIMRSPDNYNWYALTDEIQLPEYTERLGGSDDLSKKILGVVEIVPEFGSAKQFKTGVKFNSVYESELEVNLRKANYAVKVGAWTKEQADNYIKNISEQLKSGTYFNGAKLNQSQ